MEPKWELVECGGIQTYVATMGPWSLTVRGIGTEWDIYIHNENLRIWDRTTSTLEDAKSAATAEVERHLSRTLPGRIEWQIYNPYMLVGKHDGQSVEIRALNNERTGGHRWHVSAGTFQKTFDECRDAVLYAESVVLDTTQIAEVGTVRTKPEVSEYVMKQYIERIETERDEAVSRAEAAEEKLDVENAAATRVGDVFRKVVLNLTTERDETMQELEYARTTLDTLGEENRALREELDLRNAEARVYEVAMQELREIKKKNLYGSLGCNA